eukprot:1138702-Pelagomonas_calceolata.AAC.2
MLRASKDAWFAKAHREACRMHKEVNQTALGGLLVDGQKPSTSSPHTDGDGRSASFALWRTKGQGGGLDSVNTTPVLVLATKAKLGELADWWQRPFGSNFGNDWLPCPPGLRQAFLAKANMLQLIHLRLLAWFEALPPILGAVKPTCCLVNQHVKTRAGLGSSEAGDLVIDLRGGDWFCKTVLKLVQSLDPMYVSIEA